MGHTDVRRELAELEFVEARVSRMVKELRQAIQSPKFEDLPQIIVNEGEELTLHLVRLKVRDAQANRAIHAPFFVLKIPFSLEPEARDLPGFQSEQSYRAMIPFEYEIGRVERCRIVLDEGIGGA